MIASRVVSQEEVYSYLTTLGWFETNTIYHSGVFWENKKTKQRVLIPHSVQGFYPDWLLSDIKKVIVNFHQKEI